MGRFAAFHHRTFRRYFVGQVISSVGSWLQSLAVTWLVLDLTGRSDRLGVAVALQFLPLLVLGVPAGVLADRVDNRRLLLATSSVSAVLALGFGLIVSAGDPSIWVIYGLTFLSGLVLAVERPAMQAMLFQLVGRETLPSAVAANSTIISMSRLVGPALGGVIIASAGIAWCFYANAVSYVVVAAALASIHRRDLVPRPAASREGGTIRAAVTYVRNRPEVRRPLMVMVVVGLIVLNFQTTFPSIVKFGFDRGAGGVGTAMSVSAIGSILGGLYAAGLKSGARRTLAVSLGAFGVVLAAIAAAPNYVAFILISIPLGFVSAAFQTIDAVAVQQATEPSMQGRVMALHQMAWFGTTPVGALFMGWVIQTTSPRVPFVLGAAATLACSVVVIGARGIAAAAERDEQPGATAAPHPSPAAAAPRPAARWASRAATPRQR